MALRLVPITLREANAFVAANHRHHDPVRGCILGYRKLITYTLPEEGGASLRAAGWKCIGEAGGGSWSRAERPRVDTHPLQSKLRWEAA